MISRRNTLKALGVGFTGGASLPWFVRAQSQTDPFPNPLKIPPLLEGNRENDTVHYSLNLQAGTTEFFPGVTTNTWGVNQNFLGPTVRVKDGDLVAMHVRNNLPEPTTVHWHGMHLPARCDGGPSQTIAIAGNWDPMFYIRQKAGTFWYHSHMLDKSGPQVYMGLAGMLIIDDEETSSLDLPHTYGVDDIPVIVQDRNFTRAGQFQYVSGYGEMITGIQGNTILVNGTLRPHLLATTSKLRLRILNAANSRTFLFAFSDNRPFSMIASDGGLLETPVPMDRIMLAPAERAEIIVDVSDGSPVNLVSLARQPAYAEYRGGMSDLMRTMNMQGFEILAIRPQPGLTTSSPLPLMLTRLDALTPEAALNTRRFELKMGNGPRSGEDMGPGLGYRNGSGGGYGGGHFSINGRHMDMGFINERVPLNQLEIWEVYNSAVMAHPFHVHDIQFRIIDRDGAPPPPHEAGRKDTVLVHPLQTVRLLLRFEDYADAEKPYMYHCHMLEHEDHGMMGMFVVVP